MKYLNHKVKILKSYSFKTYFLTSFFIMLSFSLYAENISEEVTQNVSEDVSETLCEDLYLQKKLALAVTFKELVEVQQTQEIADRLQSEYEEAKTLSERQILKQQLDFILADLEREQEELNQASLNLEAISLKYNNTCPEE